MPSGLGAKPGIFRVFFTDYWCVLVAFVTLVFGAFNPFLLLLLPIVPLRIHTIRRTFARGETAEAEVVSHDGQKGMYTVTYQFEAAGQTIKTSDNYLIFKRLPFRKGDRLEVVYDPDKPRRSWLKFRFLRKRAGEELASGASDSAARPQAMSARPRRRVPAPQDRVTSRLHAPAQRTRESGPP